MLPMGTIRSDIHEVIANDFQTMAAPGAVLTGTKRVALAKAARTGTGSTPLEEFAAHLYQDPATVHASDVTDAAEADGYPSVVEAIGVVARLSAADRFHRVMGMDFEPLIQPTNAPPTGESRDDLKIRGAYVPMPPGAIPVALDLVPSEGKALRAMFGPLYMTEDEMADPQFQRSPGLNTPQLETIAARISLINRCFY